MNLTDILKRIWPYVLIILLLLTNFVTYKLYNQYKTLYKQAINLVKYEKEQSEVYKTFNKKVVTERDALILSSKTYKESLTKQEKKNLKERGIKPDKVQSVAEFSVEYKDSGVIVYDTVLLKIKDEYVRNFSFQTPDSLLSITGELICDTNLINCKSNIDFEISLKNGKIIVFEYTPTWYKPWDWNLFKGKRYKAQADFGNNKVKVDNLNVKVISQ
jgi:hypothetical protein